MRNIENLFNRNLLNRLALNKINKDYYKPIKLKVLLTIIIENMKAKETKIITSHLKNILIFLDHI